MFWNEIITLGFWIVTIYLLLEGRERLKRGRGGQKTKEGKRFIISGILFLVPAITFSYLLLLEFYNIIWEYTRFKSERWLGSGDLYWLIIISFVLVIGTIYLLIQKYIQNISQWSLAIRNLFKSNKQAKIDQGNHQIKDNLSQLVKVLDAYFSLDDLEEICFELEGIDYENLKGDTKKARMRDLVIQLSRRDRIKELIEVCEIERPHVPWVNLFQK